MSQTQLDREYFRLRVFDVKALEHALGGDPVVEAGLLRHIQEKFNAKNLFWLAPTVADRMLASPEHYKQLGRTMGT